MNNQISKIVLLAQGLSAAGGRSVGINIIEAVGKLRPDYEYLIIAPSGVGYESLAMPPKSKVIYHDPKRNKLHRQFFDLAELPRRVREFKPDVVWGLGNLGLMRPNAFQAILYHKPQLVYPEVCNPYETWKRRLANRALKFRVRQSLAGTDLVFCQTEVMRRRFKEAFGFQGIIELCPNAVSEHALVSTAKQVPSCLREKKGQFKFFVLTRFYAHKNLELILETFRRYREELADVCCIFTVSSEDHPRAPVFLDSIRANGLERQLVNIGPVPQAALGSYYEASDALLLPTLLESFSGTYLEAMRFSRPILTSDLDFARGICADAALYFNPWSPEALRDTILQLKSDQALARQLARAGAERLNTLTRSWSEITEGAIRRIEDLVGAGQYECRSANCRSGAKR